ncbi:MAG: hypothetical protein M3315_05740 [Actinomycetota bacterium]|jgi:hypothetical protein|nr:hypothetical protein [Actinomycetota bacterium]
MAKQISYLKSVIQTCDEELRRKDHIIAALTERMPELEPASETPESPTAPSEEPGSSSLYTPPDGERRSWLARFFGL